MRLILSRKPVDLDMLRKLVNTALKLRKDGRARRTPTRAAKLHSGCRHGLDRLIGSSPAMEQCTTMITKLARSQAPVLISGDSGSGKELAARLIHDLGPRADEPFMPVNCGAIPTELMESEFFGHRKGSFTGANADKEGLFQAADGGTLMLDEVADLPLHMQVKLLRVIQEKAVRPIGAREEVAGGRAHPQRHPPGAEAAGRGRQVPQRPVFPPERDRTAHAGAAANGARTSPCWPTFPGRHHRAVGHDEAPEDFSRGHGGAERRTTTPATCAN